MKRSELKRSTPMKRCRPKSTPARRSAEGQMCQVRIPGTCNGNPETTVLAHFLMNTGGGMKPNDSQGAYACSACHDVVDERVPIPAGYTRNDIRLMHAEGCFRTQTMMRKTHELSDRN